MEQRNHTELEIEQQEVEDLLKTRVCPEDEIINFIFALLARHDSQLCQRDPSRCPSFFRSYFMTNLLNEGSESDRQYIYDENVSRWSQNNNLFEHDKYFGPIYIENRHSILTVIFITKKHIQIFDRVEYIA